MKELLIKFIQFTSIIIFIIAGLVIVSELAVKSRKQQILKLSDDIHMVFAGDSNVECSINDSLILNSINIAQSGEAYMYTYFKIRALIECNDSINIIFIGFSDVNILRETEKRWLYKEEFIIEKVGLYNYLLGSSEKLFIAEQNPKAYFKGLLSSVLNNTEIFIKSFYTLSSRKHITNFGGFEYLVRDKVQEEVAIVISKEQFVEPEKSILQEKYLRMISDLCSGQSIKLILFNTPKHRFYNANINETAEQIWISVRNEFPQDSLLDLSAYTLPDGCFGDLKHLNYKGAKVFSEFLNKTLHSDHDFIPGNIQTE